MGFYRFYFFLFFMFRSQLYSVRNIYHNITGLTFGSNCWLTPSHANCVPIGPHFLPNPSIPSALQLFPRVRFEWLFIKYIYFSNKCRTRIVLSMGHYFRANSVIAYSLPDKCQTSLKNCVVIILKFYDNKVGSKSKKSWKCFYSGFFLSTFIQFIQWEAFGNLKLKILITMELILVVIQGVTKLLSLSIRT